MIVNAKGVASVAVIIVLAACAPTPGGVASSARSVSPSGQPITCAAAAVNVDAPSARANAAFAFDVDHREMVLFGGNPGSLSDTWTWDGRWTQQHPALSPPAASQTAMAYDVIHHEMVMYVPVQGPGTAPETWTWAGHEWAQRRSIHVPPSRDQPAMASDPSRGGVVLVGGTASGDRSDVWAWNGVDWTEVVPDQGPIFGSAHSIVVSPKTGGAVIVVGNLGAYQLQNGAWSSLGVPWPSTAGFVGNVSYEGAVGFVRFAPDGKTSTWLPGRDSTWQALTPACSPPGRWINGERPAMAYDGWRDVAVLFGGFDRNDTWTFDGKTWTPATGATPPASPGPSPTPGAGAWSRLPDLHTGRVDATATVLPDGRVLVAGGSEEAEIPIATAEIFDPRTNAWSAVAPMTSPRARHTATLLRDGRVLMVGGLGPGRGTAELYDPATNAWSPAGNLVAARANHQAVLLGDGSVLVVGGRQAGRPLSSAEVFDPKTRSWTAVASLSVARDRPQAVALHDGRVLVTGGVTIDTGGSLDASVLFGSPLATIELYDPTKKTWAAGPPMAVGRVGHAMAVLRSGQVLVLGGTRDDAPAEIYDPLADTWSEGPVLSPRIAPAVGLLSDGEVVVAGGLKEDYDATTVASTGYTPVLLDSVMVFDPSGRQWTAGASLGVARWLATGSLLQDGRFLVCGGGNPLAAGSAAVEAFTKPAA